MQIQTSQHISFFTGCTSIIASPFCWHASLRTHVVIAWNHITQLKQDILQVILHQTPKGHLLLHVGPVFIELFLCYNTFLLLQYSRTSNHMQQTTRIATLQQQNHVDNMWLWHSQRSLEQPLQSIHTKSKSINLTSCCLSNIVHCLYVEFPLWPLCLYAAPRLYPRYTCSSNACIAWKHGRTRP